MTPRPRSRLLLLPESSAGGLSFGGPDAGEALRAKPRIRRYSLSRLSPGPLPADRQTRLERLRRSYD